VTAVPEDQDWLQHLQKELAATPPAIKPPAHILKDEHLTRALDALAAVTAADEEDDMEDDLEYFQAFCKAWSMTEVARKDSYPVASRRVLIEFMSTLRIETAERELLVAKHDRAEAHRILDTSALHTHTHL
jgi:hypothetical protein